VRTEQKLPVILHIQVEHPCNDIDDDNPRPPLWLRCRSCDASVRIIDVFVAPVHRHRRPIAGAIDHDREVRPGVF